MFVDILKRVEFLESMEIGLKRELSVESRKSARLTEALKALRDRLMVPIHPYGDKRQPVVLEHEFLSDAYGEDLPKDMLKILDEALGVTKSTGPTLKETDVTTSQQAKAEQIQERYGVTFTYRRDMEDDMKTSSLSEGEVVALVEAAEAPLRTIMAELQSADSSTTIGEFQAHLTRIAETARNFFEPPRVFTDAERHRKLVTEGLPQGLQATRYNPDWTVKA